MATSCAALVALASQVFDRRAQVLGLLVEPHHHAIALELALTELGLVAALELEQLRLSGAVAALKDLGLELALLAQPATDTGCMTGASTDLVVVGSAWRAELPWFERGSVLARFLVQHRFNIASMKGIQAAALTRP